MSSPIEAYQNSASEATSSARPSADGGRNSNRCDTEATTASDVKAVASAFSREEKDERIGTNCEDRKKDLGPIGANHSATTHFDELSIIALRPSSGARPTSELRHNINDSVISIESIRASASSHDDADNNNIDVGGQAAAAATASDAATTSISVGDDAQTSQSQLGDISNHSSGSSSSSGSNNNNNNNTNGLWMVSMAAQTTQEMRQRVSMASDQLGLSLRQLYASATTMATTSVDVPPSYHNIPGIVPYYRGRSSGPPPSYDDVINPYASPPTYQSLFGQMREARKNSRGFIDLLKRLVILSTIGCSLLLAFVLLVPFTMIIVGAVYLNDCRVEHIPGFLLVGGLVWASKNIVHCCAQCRDDSNGSGGGGGSDDDLPEYGYYEEQQRQLENDAQLTRQTNGLSVSASDSVGTTNTHPETFGSTNEQSPRLMRRTSSGRRATKSSICESLLNCILFGWFVAGCVIVFKNHNPDFEDPTSPRFCNRTVYMYTFWLVTSGLVMFSLFVSCICCLMISSAIATRQDDDLS